MRFALAVAVCGGLVLTVAGCGGGSSSGAGGTPPVLPPTANAGGPYTGTAGVAVTFNGQGSSDPQNQALTYAWTFGDGGTGTGATPMHTYAQVAGQTSTKYTVSLTVQDTSGFTGQASSSATIQGPALLPDATLTGVVATGPGGSAIPIAGAHVYLFAANTAGYGAASLSLLSATETGASDSVGAYVLTDELGNYNMSGGYTCSSGQQLYVYALGGTAATTSVPSAGLLAAIGSCPAVGASVTAQVNEVTTIAAAYAMAGFAKDAVHVSSSGTALALTGIANAFANAANLVKLSTGVALAATPTSGSTGVVPQAEINSLANILSVCVNPGNATFPFAASNCSLLLGDELSGGTSGATPTDTATVAINIAHNPGSILDSDIYNIPNASPYTPVVSRQPNDYTIAISYSGGGLSGPQGIAIDAGGNAWVTNATVAGVTKLSSLGAVATGSPFTGGGISTPYGIAIDGSGNAWVANSGSVTELSAAGAAISGSPFTVCNLSGPRGIAIDGSNNVWIPDYGHNDVCELSNAGALVAGSPYTLGGFNSPDAIAIDSSGNAWVANSSGSVSRLTNAGAVVAGSPYSNGGLQSPNGIAIDANGSAWLSNLSPSGVPEISKAGAVVLWTDPSLSSPVGVAVDGLGNVWIANQVGNTVTEFSNGGFVLSGSTGYGGAAGAASGIAVDGSGNVWVGNNTKSSVTEYIGAAAPVVTPLAGAVKNNTLGTRP